MSKRKRNDNSDTSKKGQTGSLDEVAAISAAVKTFTVKDASQRTAPKQSTFHNTGLPAYFSLREAEKALAMNPRDKTIFSFELPTKSRLYVIGSLKEFAKICFERSDNCYPSFKYNYELLFDNKPMKLYCDAEYYHSENEEKDPLLVLDALKYYICKTFSEISSPPAPADLLVETCHRDGKISFHIKIPDQFGVVTCMAHQKAFWSRVVQAAEQDITSEDSERKNKARNMRVFRTRNNKVGEDWVLDFSVYKTHSQLFRNLKAAKCPSKGVVKEADFLVPFGKSLKQVTATDWFCSLIMNVSSNSPTLPIPCHWTPTTSNFTPQEMQKSYVGGATELKDAMISDSDFKLFTSLMKDVDANWSIDEKSRLLVKSVYYNEVVDILPKAILIIPKSTYCPIKKGHHDTCAVSLKIRQDGSISINCLANNHPNQANQLHLPFWSFSSSTRNDILLDKWANHKWISSLNERFACLRITPTKKDIVEFYVDGEECNLEFYSCDNLKSFYTNCSAYSVKRRDQKSSEEQQPSLQKNNPIVCWYGSNGRKNFNKMDFDPMCKTNKNLNTWRGFGIKPKESSNPCPLLRQHIKEVLVSNNEEHYHYLINWMAWLIQRPHIKTKVAPVFISEQGSGKSFLAEVLMKILWVHCMQVIDQQHFFGKFNGFLENKVLIILNESTWGGDKAHEGQLKSYITDDQSTMQEKFGEITQKRNYLNVIILSNNAFSFPGTPDNRRILCTEVSNHRIGDHEYFNKLYAEFYNEGDREFLYFLQKHTIPNGWTPSEYLPRRTPGILRAIIQDRSNIELPWLMSKLHQGGWTAQIKTETFRGFHMNKSHIIYYETENTVSSNELMDAWDSECSTNRDLQRYSKIRDIKQLKTFFTKWLCGKECKLFQETTTKDLDGKKVRGYKFGSVQQIRQHFAREWGYDQWDNEDDCHESEEFSDSAPKSKKPKPSQEQIRKLSHLCLQGDSSAIDYVNHIFGNDAMSIGENSNDSKMSLARSEAERNVDQRHDEYMASIEDDLNTNPYFKMDDIQEDSDESKDSNLAYRKRI
jgi:hypothetical protein